MKTIETDDRLPNWVNRLLNWLALHVEDVLPLFTLTWGMGTAERPNLGNYRVTRGASVVAERTAAPYDASGTALVRNWTVQSLFYNGLAFLRVLKPFGVFFMVRSRARILYGSLGWKVNGRLTIGLGPVLIPLAAWFVGWWALWLLPTLFALRVQSDESAAAGDQGPNYGQAGGFIDGTK